MSLVKKKKKKAFGFPLDSSLEGFGLSCVSMVFPELNHGLSVSHRDTYLCVDFTPLIFTQHF